MNPEFKPNEIERAAQAAWAAADAYRVREDASRAKFYACSMSVSRNSSQVRSSALPWTFSSAW